MIVDKNDFKLTTDGAIEYRDMLFTPLRDSDFKKDWTCVFLSPLPDGSVELWPGLFWRPFVKSHGLPLNTIFQILGIKIIDRCDATHWGFLSLPARRVIEMRKDQVK
jgi:hypothetical protein